jgi:hypothetical protein
MTVPETIIAAKNALVSGPRDAVLRHDTRAAKDGGLAARRPHAPLADVSDVELRRALVLERVGASLDGLLLAVEQVQDKRLEWKDAPKATLIPKVIDALIALALLAFPAGRIVTASAWAVSALMRLARLQGPVSANAIAALRSISRTGVPEKVVSKAAEKAAGIATKQWRAWREGSCQLRPEAPTRQAFCCLKRLSNC